MCRKMKVILQLKVLLTTFQVLNAAKFVFILENEEVYTSCPNQPEQVQDIEGLFDFSALTMKMESDYSIKVSGNLTSVWNIEKTDRIECRFDVYKFVHRTWMPSGLALWIPDFCKVLYDKNQHWYSFWARHIINANEIKENCLNVPGTIFVHEPFVPDLRFNIPGIMNGLHKVVASVKAVSPRNEQRKTSICFEVIGEVEII